MFQLEDKFHDMDIGVQRFFSKIDALQKKGLPSLMVMNDKLMNLQDYKQRIVSSSQGYKAV
jgi:hypothetical protein